ncbi:MAG: hypothetical protein ACRDRH_00215 [Pseudonocardia sp.]
MNQDYDIELIEPDPRPVAVADRRPDSEPPPATVPGTTVNTVDLPPRPLDRRPIVPVWVRDGRQRRALARWLAAYVWHTTAFHTVRVPKYLTRTVVYAPRGAGRAIAALVRWLSDAEGQPLRLHAIERDDVTGYLSLSRQRNNRVRLRLATAASLTACAASALSIAAVLWPRSPWPLLALAVALAGWYGCRQDRRSWTRPSSPRAPASSPPTW